MSTLKPGDQVTFIEAVDAGDEDVRFTVVEDRGDRVLVSLNDAGFAIVPTFVYQVSELKAAP